MNRLGGKETRALAERMQREQPFVLVYLLAADEHNQDEHGDAEGQLMELGATIWYVLSETQPGLRQVTEHDLEAAETANIRYLEGLDEGPEARVPEATAHLFQTYNQMPLLGAVLEALMDPLEDSPELAGERVGMDLIRLKTVIDCLDQ